MRLPTLLAFVMFALAPPALQAETVRAAGTATGMALLQMLDRQMPDERRPRLDADPVRLKLGSNGSLRALAAGRIDLAITGRAPKPGDGEFRTIGFAVTPQVLASAPRVAPQNLSRRDVVDLFAGRTRQWPDGETVRLVLRAPFESDVTVLRELAPGMGQAIDEAIARKAGPVGETDVDALELLARLPGSFGTTTLGLMRIRDVRLTVHAIDGVTPSTATLASGHYPMAKRIYLVTRPQPDAATADYVAFLLSKPVREALRRLDYIPSDNP